MTNTMDPMDVIEATDTEISLLKARRLTAAEGAKYMDWYKELGLIAIGSGTVLDHVSRLDMPTRKADGMFAGCNNTAWTLSQDEVAHYIALNRQRAGAKAADAKAISISATAGRSAIISKARETGKPQVISSDMVDCDGSAHECSFDALTTYAMPDGTVTTRRTHCY